MTEYDELLPTIDYTVLANNIGLRVSVQSLPSAALVARARRLMYGGNFVSRLWAQRIRPWLQPGLQDEIEMCWEDARRIQRREFFDALLEGDDD